MKKRICMMPQRVALGQGSGTLAARFREKRRSLEPARGWETQPENAISKRADRLQSRLLCLLFMGIREKWRAGLLRAGWLSFLASRSHSGLHEEQGAGNEWTGCRHCVFCSAIYSMMS
jgi:hypothetical protein